jgi:hypothetical protein
VPVTCICVFRLYIVTARALNPLYILCVFVLVCVYVLAVSAPVLQGHVAYFTVFHAAVQ